MIKLWNKGNLFVIDDTSSKKWTYFNVNGSSSSSWSPIIATLRSFKIMTANASTGYLSRCLQISAPWVNQGVNDIYLPIRNAFISWAYVKTFPKLKLHRDMLLARETNYANTWSKGLICDCSGKCKEHRVHNYESDILDHYSYL